MPAVTVWIDIKASLARVWEAAADLAGHGQWMGDVESILFDGEQRSGPGTIMRVATRVGPLRTSDVMVVTGWEPLQRIAVVHRGLVKGTGEFTLAAVGGATRFTWSEQLEFPWQFGGPVGAVLARPLFAWIWRANLRRLKRLLENEGG